ncbi:hypothetical protein LFM09_39915 [Lentzea alba]|uniref:hypothetical protein n=1 Tax=Lentzea alba TaxID=2714351 RepID=UPI0039BF6125
MNPSTAGISRRRLLIAAAGAAGVAALPGLAHAAPDSRGTRTGFHDIGSLAGPGTASEGADINDRGDVVGVTALPGTAVSHAFIMNPGVEGGRLFDLMPSEPRSSRADAVNRYGVVAGTLGLGLPPSSGAAAQARLMRGVAGAAERANEPTRAFVWSARTGIDVLPLPPGAFAALSVDINDRGTVLVVGTNDVPDPNVPGLNFPIGSFLWNPATRTYTQLPPPDPSVPGAVALARKLDARGGAAGGVIVPIDAVAWRHTAVVWDPGTRTPHTLTSGGTTDTFASDRNESGMVVGWRSNGAQPTAVYWPSRTADPVELPGRVASEVNDRGQIAGAKDFPGSTAFPFSSVVWEPLRGRTTELRDNGLGSYVVAINASGRTAGYALAATDGRNHTTACWWEAPRR